MKGKSRKILEFAGVLTGVALIAVLLAPRQADPASSPSQTASSSPESESLTNCKSNLKDICTSLEMYATDWNGVYPETLIPLTPNYLKVIPACPSVQSDTYSASYSTSSRAGVQCREHPGDPGQKLNECQINLLALSYELDALGATPPKSLKGFPRELVVCPIEGVDYWYNSYRRVNYKYEYSCQGAHHLAEVGSTNYPRFNSRDGLIEGPPNGNDNRTIGKTNESRLKKAIHPCPRSCRFFADR